MLQCSITVALLTWPRAVYCVRVNMIRPPTVGYVEILVHDSCPIFPPDEIARGHVNHRSEIWIDGAEGLEEYNPQCVNSV